MCTLLFIMYCMVCNLSDAGIEHARKMVYCVYHWNLRFCASWHNFQLGWLKLLQCWNLHSEPVSQIVQMLGLSLTSRIKYLPFYSYFMINTSLIIKAYNRNPERRLVKTVFAIFFKACSRALLLWWKFRIQLLKKGNQQVKVVDINEWQEKTLNYLFKE